MAADTFAAIEVLAQFTVHEGEAVAFRESVNACVDRVRANEPDTLRYDWYVDEPAGEAVALDVYANPAALLHHLGNLRNHFPAVLKHASARLSFLGDPGSVITEATQRMAMRQYYFLDGIHAHSSGSQFGRNSAKPAHRPIEILSQFAVFDGHGTRFCELAREHVAVVRSKDPATLRYDWFVDERNQSCITLDTYADAQGMFAHMRNCRDIHHEFRSLANMSTVFLGELPAEAREAVAKYEPRVLPFYAGIRT